MRVARDGRLDEGFHDDVVGRDEDVRESPVLERLQEFARLAVPLLLFGGGQREEEARIDEDHRSRR
jgi:hypothetical protein